MTYCVGNVYSTQQVIRKTNCKYKYKYKGLEITYE